MYTTGSYCQEDKSITISAIEKLRERKMEKWRGRRVVMLLLPPLEMKRMPTLPSLSVMVVVVVALMGQQMTPTDAFVPPDPHAYARLRDQLRVTTRNQHLLNPQQQGLGLIPFFPTPLRMLHPAVLDATGKIPDGMLVGNLVSLGSFDECLAVRADITGDPLLIIGEGVSLDMLPDALDATAGGAGFQFVVQERDCAEDSATVFSAADYCIMALVAAVVMLMVAGTIVDVRLLATQAQLKKFDDHPQRLMDGEKSITSGFQLLKNGKCWYSAIQFLTSFSVYTNGKKILSTADHPDDIGCLHGLRFISMTWVILAHTYGFGGINPWVNLAQGLPAFLRQWEFTAVANASTSVDTFFLLSGLLVAYNVLKEVQRAKGRLRPDPVTWLGVLYVLRYVRLTPAFAAGIGLVATLVRRVGEGPLWGQLLENSDLCRHDWWKYLLYAHNYVRPDVYYDNQITCFPQAWYLACDMQLFLLAPLFILPMFYLGTTGRRRWAAYAWISLLTVISVVPGLVIMIRNSGYPPTLIPNNQQTAFFYDIYANTYVRAGPYLVGIALGYYIFMNKKQQNINDRSPSSTSASAAAPRLSRLVVALAWLAATGAALAVVYGLQAYEPYESDKPSHVENIFYSAFARMAWALAVAWLIFACHYGYGDAVDELVQYEPSNGLLDDPLLHNSTPQGMGFREIDLKDGDDTLARGEHPQQIPPPAEQGISSELLQRTQQLERKENLEIYWFLGTLTLTTAGAFLFSLMFEMPFVGISKLLLSPARGSRTTKKPSSPAAAVTSPVESKNDGQVNPGFEAGPEGEKHVETTIIEVPKKAAVLSA
ncbi:unnamed protein product [Notodromas monacha]|uniref:Acyltransferase 3 domain-containing protein n=1 Tax=Notodromas monacha TaxID=399045 RepID=A0A7R9BVB6_9CRUS|nr:unnamed protein product [Notodromas monacha]CAG0921073.1 unnamed protein product [Notodromas monacha]